MNRRNFLEKIRGKQAEVETIPLTASEYDGSVDATAMNTFTNWSGDTYAAQHLLRRVMFGAPAATINEFKSKTLNQAVVELLTVSADPPPELPADFWTSAFHSQLQADLAAGVTPAWLQVDPPPPINDYSYDAIDGDGNPVSYSDDYVPKGMTWVASPEHNGNRRNFHRSIRRISFEAWWTKLIMNQGNNIREKMTLFWHNHFGIRTDDSGFRGRRYWNNALLRYHALGNFKSIMKAITFDPQMMYMLGMGYNTATNLDENYAREFLELFSLGLDEDDATNPTGNSFNRDDITALARIMTGYQFKSTINIDDDGDGNGDGNEYGAFIIQEFNPNKHDTGPKQFSTFFNNLLITGKTDTNGTLEFDEFLDAYFDQHGLQIGKFLATEIYRFFVRPAFNYKEPYATNSQEHKDIYDHVITPMANIFVANNYEVQPIIEALLKSQHFFSDCNRGGMVKSPIDYVFGVGRDFSVFPGTYLNSASQPLSDVNVERTAYRGIVHMAIGAGQYIDDPLEVSGWPAYYFNVDSKTWINGPFFTKRVKYANEFIEQTGCNIAYNVIDSLNSFKLYLDEDSKYWRMQEVDLIQFIVDNVSNPYQSQVIVDELCELFFTVPIHHSVRNSLQFILGNQDGDYYWSDNWYNANSAPTAPNHDSNTALSQLRQLRIGDFSRHVISFYYL